MAVAVWEAVAVPEAVAETVGVAVVVAVRVAVLVAVAITVEDAVGVEVAVADAVAVALGVTVTLAVAVGVRVGVGVAVIVGVAVEPTADCLVIWNDWEAATTVPSSSSFTTISYWPGASFVALRVSSEDAALGAKDCETTFLRFCLRIFSHNRYLLTGIPGDGWIVTATCTACVCSGVRMPLDG